MHVRHQNPRTPVWQAVRLLSDLRWGFRWIYGALPLQHIQFLLFGWWRSHIYHSHITLRSESSCIDGNLLLSEVRTRHFASSFLGYKIMSQSMCGWSQKQLWRRAVRISMWTQIAVPNCWGGSLSHQEVQPKDVSREGLTSGSRPALSLN